MDDIARKEYHYVDIVTSLYIYDDLFLAKIYNQCKIKITNSSKDVQGRICSAFGR